MSTGEFRGEFKPDREKLSHDVIASGSALPQEKGVTCEESFQNSASMATGEFRGEFKPDRKGLSHDVRASGSALPQANVVSCKGHRTTSTNFPFDPGKCLDSDMTVSSSDKGFTDSDITVSNSVECPTDSDIIVSNSVKGPTDSDITVSGSGECTHSS